VFGAESVKLGNRTEILRNCTIDGTPGAREAIALGAGCRLKENVWLAAYGGRIEIGERVLIGRNVVIQGHGNVTIGAHTMIGPGSMIFSSDHLVAPDGIFQDMGNEFLPTLVAENVWLGSGVIVLGGSVVERNVVVAAGSVVKGRLESGFIYGGTPARKLRSIAEMAYSD